MVGLSVVITNEQSSGPVTSPHQQQQQQQQQGTPTGSQQQQQQTASTGSTAAPQNAVQPQKLVSKTPAATPQHAHHHHLHQHHHHHHQHHHHHHHHQGIMWTSVTNPHHQIVHHHPHPQQPHFVAHHAQQHFATVAQPLPPPQYQPPPPPPRYEQTVPSPAPTLLQNLALPPPKSEVKFVFDSSAKSNTTTTTTAAILSQQAQIQQQQQQPVLIVVKNPTTGEDETFMVMPEVQQQLPTQVPIAAAKEEGSYKLLIRKEKKTLFDEICEAASKILGMPGGLLQSCIVIQCPEELLRREDVLEVVDNFTKAATERMNGDIQKVPLVGMKEESIGQVSCVVTVEAMPAATREEAVRSRRLAAPVQTQVVNGMVTISASQLQQLLAGRSFPM